MAMTFTVFSSGWEGVPHLLAGTLKPALLGVLWPELATCACLLEGS